MKNGMKKGKKKVSKMKFSTFVCILGFCFVLFFVFLGPHPAAHGGSQASDQIGAVAAGLHHSHQSGI